MQVANEPPEFFLVNGLTLIDYYGCLERVRSRYAGCSVDPLTKQGGCSFTVLVSPGLVDDTSTHPELDADDNGIYKRLSADRRSGPRLHQLTSVVGRRCVIAQFRLQRYALLPSTAREVARVYGLLAPRPLHFHDLTLAGGIVGLQYCEMTRVPGRRFSDLQPRTRRLSADDSARLRALMTGLAGFFARGWRAALSDETDRECDGKIGSSFLQRLGQLEHHLPSTALRRRAGIVRRAVAHGGLRCLPIVLNHGDLLPTNILVSGRTWDLTGVIDWAEAEYLPFGMSLYGIEHVLGYVEHDKFVNYGACAEWSRRHFWQCVEDEIPELRTTSMRDAVRLSREVGIFLWHGFAWDDGKIDRVINDEADVQELAYLEAFLAAECPLRKTSVL